jgi:ATP-dependent Clp protease ATP-binding subunit ClpA
MIKDLRADPLATVLLNQHPQISLIMDALCSFEYRDLMLVGSSSTKINLAIIEGLLTHTTTEFFYAEGLINEKTVAALDPIKKEIAASKKKAVFVTTQLPTVALGLDPAWRVIVIIDPATYQQSQTTFAQIRSCFSVIHLTEPHESELIGLLQSHRVNLENYHSVAIPDDVVSLAFTLSSHYLPGPSHFDRAFELLDRAATRTRSFERTDLTGNAHKPIVSSHTLAEIISQWTRIPSLHLQNNKFQAAPFSHALSQHVFGQEGAITLISAVLQQAYVRLHENKGPLCSFLFSGPSDVGKTEFTFKMAQYLFGHDHALLQVSLDQNQKSLRDIQVINNPRTENLLEAIQQCPYAIILIDDIQAEQTQVLSLFKEIFTRGCVIEQGQKYDFSHAIIIMTTRIGAESVSHLLHPAHSQEQSKTPDLLQLVLNENILDIPLHATPTLSTEELCEALAPALEEHFPLMLLQKAHVVPFVPLCFSALEKIIRLKIKELIKRLEHRLSIELNYAPEIIKFLAHEAYWRKANKSLEKLLQQMLYSCIAQELLEHNQDKQRPRRLLLQLHENGHSLRCEFITDAAVHRV